MTVRKKSPPCQSPLAPPGSRESTNTPLKVAPPPGRSLSESVGFNGSGSGSLEIGHTFQIHVHGGASRRQRQGQRERNGQSEQSFIWEHKAFLFEVIVASCFSAPHGR